MFPTRIGRSTSALLGAALATGVQFFSSDFSEVANGVDLSTLALLLGQFIISVYVVETGLMHKAREILVATGSDVRKIIKFCIIVSIVSPLMMNDTVCILLTRCTILDAASFPKPHLHESENDDVERRGKNSIYNSKRSDILGHILALGIATCSNIASAITATGNPQNGLVVELSGINAGIFIAGSILPSVLALLLNVCMLVAYYKFLIHPSTGPTGIIRTKVDLLKKDVERGQTLASPESEENFELNCTTKDSDFAAEPRYYDSAKSVNSAKQLSLNSGRKASLKLLRLLVGGSLVLLLVLVTALRVDPGWASLAVGIFLIVATQSEGDKVLRDREIDYNLLLIFVGQFILVQRLVDTGLPQEIFARIFQTFDTVETGVGLVVLSAVTIIASNIVSNVPVILMLAQVNVNGQPLINSTASWLAVAWFSTVAGNLLLLGSAANLIVVRQLAEHGKPDRLDAFSHAIFGVPSTLVVWGVGLVYFEYILPAIPIS